MAGRDGNIRLHTASQLLDRNVLSSDAMGLARTALLPSLGVHGGLSIIAYGIARASDRVELKDYLWPTGMVLNAWWVAIGRHMVSHPHISFGQAWSRLSYHQLSLLGAATAWSGRLTYRIISRSLRRGTDDPRYKDVKTEPGFWNKAPFAIFLPEALFQALITLPLVIPFSDDHITGLYGASSHWATWFRLGAAGIFATGLTMETLADNQIENHKRQPEERGKNKILRSGVWSIVRHPNYLGDALCHLARCWDRLQTTCSSVGLEATSKLEFWSHVMLCSITDKQQAKRRIPKAAILKERPQQVPRIPRVPETEEQLLAGFLRDLQPLVSPLHWNWCGCCWR
jgi:steroid 5-alpha reductase family enzyme